MRGKSWSYSFKADNERTEAREDAGERPCARLEWCASATRVKLDDGTTGRTPATGPRAFCAADEAIIGDCLREFPATWRRLWPALLEHVTTEVLVRVPFGPACPVRTDVDAVMRALVDCALSWHERVAAVDPTLSPPCGDWHRKSLGRHAPRMLAESASRLGERVTVLVALGPEAMARPDLVTGLGCGTAIGNAGAGWSEAVAVAAGLSPGSPEWLMVIEEAPKPPPGLEIVEADGAAAGNEVLRLDYLARAALGEIDPAPVRLIGVPCRECQRAALQLAPPKQHEADEQFYSVCSWCRDAMDEPTYRAWVKAWAAYYENRVTPAMAAAG